MQGSGARAHIVGHRMGEQREPAVQLHVGPPKRPRQTSSRTAGEASTSGTMSLGGLANRGELAALAWLAVVAELHLMWQVMRSLIMRCC